MRDGIVPLLFAGAVGYLVYRNRVQLGLSPGAALPPTPGAGGAGGGASSAPPADSAAAARGGSAVATGYNRPETVRATTVATRTAGPESAREAAAGAGATGTTAVRVVDADNPFGLANGTRLNHHQWNYYVAARSGEQPDPELWAPGATGTPISWREYVAARSAAGWPVPAGYGVAGLTGNYLRSN